MGWYSMALSDVMVYGFLMSKLKKFGLYYSLAKC